MKTKLLLTVLFSIGIIGITNAQTGHYINHAKTKAVITRHEGREIRHDERRNHHDIHRFKHNHRTRRF